MDVKEFIAEYNAAEDKEKCIKKHIIKDKYVPYIEKTTRCTNIINHTMYTNDGDVNVFKQNSSLQHVLFVLTLVDLYSDIDINFEGINFINNFDELSKYDLVNQILMILPKYEIDSWNMFFNMCIDDLIENTRSIGGIIDTKLAASKMTIDMISDMITGL